jgi:hypothetical protein
MVIDTPKLVDLALKKGVHLFVKDGVLGFKLKKGMFFCEELKRDIITNKPDIITFLNRYGSQNKIQRTQVTAIERNRNSFPLSFAQRRLWFIDQLNNGSPEYNMPVAFELSGDFNIVAAEQAIERIVERHEVLRTVYRETEQEAMQQINKQFDFGLEQFDLSSLSESTRQIELKNLIEADAQKVFDLSSDLMVRASFIRLGEFRGALLFNMHHIASDGW